MPCSCLQRKRSHQHPSSPPEPQGGTLWANLRAGARCVSHLCHTQPSIPNRNLHFHRTNTHMQCLLVGLLRALRRPEPSSVSSATPRPAFSTKTTITTISTEPTLTSNACSFVCPEPCADRSAFSPNSLNAGSIQGKRVPQSPCTGVGQGVRVQIQIQVLRLRK